MRDGLAVALTAGSGALDAVCFLALGKVFASVITGNLVLLGLGLVGSEAEAAAHAGAAIAAYVAGVAAGAAVAGQVVAQRAQWPRRVSAVLLVELALLVAFAVGWQLVGAADAVPPGPGTGELGSGQHGPGRLVLLVLAAAAMGLQSVGVQRLAVSGFSTTYLTSTLIAVITELVTGTRRQLGFRSLALLGMVAGAVCGAALWHAAPRLAALPAPLVLATVLATAVWLRRGGRALAG